MLGDVSNMTERDFYKMAVLIKTIELLKNELLNGDSTAKKLQTRIGTEGMSALTEVADDIKYLFDMLAYLD